MKMRKVLPLFLALALPLSGCFDNGGSSKPSGTSTSSSSEPTPTTSGEPASNSSITSVTLNKSSLSLRKGDAETLVATVTGTGDYDSSVTWSSNSEEIDVTSAGKVFVSNSASVGSSAVIIAKSNQDSSKFATCSVVVVSSPVTPSVNSVTLSEHNLQIEVGGSFSLSATVDAINGAPTTVNWTSSNPKVSVTNGQIVVAEDAVVNSVALIQATSTYDSSKYDICSVLVLAKSTPGADPVALKAKMDAFVSNVQTNHNYTVSMTSYDEAEPTDVLTQSFYNIDDKAFYFKNGYGKNTGYIYQKNQGFVEFEQLSDESAISARDFLSTNVEAVVSELVPISLEQILKASYTQVNSSPNQFRIEDTTAIAVALNHTGYNMGNVISSGEMFLSVSDSNAEFYASVDFTIAYDGGLYPAHAAFVISNLGSTVNAVISDYFDNPTNTYTAPSGYGDYVTSMFNPYFNEYVPPFLSGASYTFEMHKGSETQRYDGMHFFLSDLVCGDKRAEFGAALLLEGFELVPDSSYQYKKSVVVEETSSVDNYSINLYYTDPSYQEEGQIHNTGYYNPNGIFEVEFHYDISSDVDTVEKLNEYIVKNDLRRYVPLYPEGKSTSVYGFRDRTEAYNQLYGGCVFITAGKTGNFFDIKYENANDAKADVNAYVALLASRGFTSVSNMKNGVLACSNPTSAQNSPSIVWITDPDYITTGNVQIRYQIYDYDALPVDPDGPVTRVLKSISLNTSAVQKTFDVGDTFNYDNLVVTARYSNTEQAVVTPTSVSTPDMSSSGEKEVVVKYRENGITRQASYNITVMGVGDHLISYNVIDEGGNPIDALDVDNSVLPGSASYGEVTNISVVAKDGYNYCGFGFPFEYFDDPVFMEYFNEHDFDFTEPDFSFMMSDFDVTVNLVFSEVPPTPTHSVTFNKDSHVLAIVSTQDFSEVEVGETVSFAPSCENGYEVDQVTSDDVMINKVGNQYTFTMVDKDVVINVTSKTAPVSATHKITFITDDHIVSVNTATYGIDKDAVAPETKVTFSVTFESGYEINTYDIDVAGTDFHQNLLVPNSFAFNMPDQDVIVTLTSKESGVTPPPVVDTYSVSFANNDHISSVSHVDLSAVSAGQTVNFTPVVEDGYEIVSVSTNPSAVVTQNGDSYSFTMPSSDVTVNFVTQESSGGGGEEEQTSLDYSLVVPMSNPAYYNKYTISLSNEDNTGVYIRTTVNASGTTVKDVVHFTYSINGDKLNLTLVSGDITGAASGYRLFTGSEPGNINNTGVFVNENTLSIQLCKADGSTVETPYTFVKE